MFIGTYLLKVWNIPSKGLEQSFYRFGTFQFTMERLHFMVEHLTFYIGTKQFFYGTKGIYNGTFDFPHWNKSIFLLNKTNQEL